MQVLKTQRFDSSKIQNLAIEQTKYDDCIFFNCEADCVTWKKCHFYNTSFLHDTKLRKCKFIDCKFTGQHTNLGGPTIYCECAFENVVFKNIQFWGATFINCTMEGTAYNIVLYGNEAPEGWITVFDNVDVRELKLELVDFRCNFDLSRTIR